MPVSAWGAIGYGYATIVRDIVPSTGSFLNLILLTLPTWIPLGSVEVFETSSTYD